MGEALRESARLFRASWRKLLLVHGLLTLASVAFLGPLLTALMGLLVLASGDVALTDEDILFFVLSPRGALSFALVASLQLTLLVIEMAALMVAAAWPSSNTPFSLSALGGFLASRLMPLFRLAIRLVARLILSSLPFLGLLYLVYLRFLSRYDINYYLVFQPAEWWWAIGLASVCLLVMAWVWLRVLVGFMLTLPRVTFMAGPDLSRALARARDAAGQIRRHLFRLLSLWLAASVVLFFGVSALFDLGIGAAIRMSGHSLQVLAYALIVVSVVWVLLQFVASWLCVSALSLGLLAAARAVWPRLLPSAGEYRPAGKRPASRARWQIGLPAAFLVVLLSLAGWAVTEVAGHRTTGHHTDVIAHRGASAHAPENSLAAIELAIEQGADWVEIDVQQTADGHIAVIHDSDLMKVAGVPLRVRESSMAQLQAVDIGSRLGPEYAGQSVPALNEVLRRVRGRIGVIIELKYYGGEHGFEAEVARLVERAGVVEQARFMSLNLGGVRALKALRPSWQVGLLSTVVVGDIQRFEVDFFAVNARKAGRRFIRNTQRGGRSVYAWTINDPALMSAMIGREVDGIITDYPDVANRVRAERDALELHELLIINLASRLGSRLDLPQ